MRATARGDCLQVRTGQDGWTPAPAPAGMGVVSAVCRLALRRSGTIALLRLWSSGSTAWLAGPWDRASRTGLNAGGMWDGWVSRQRVANFSPYTSYTALRVRIWARVRLIGPQKAYIPVEPRV